MKNTLLTLFLMGLTVSSFSQETYKLSDTSVMTIDGSSSLHDWTVTANTMEGTVAENGESVTAVDFSVAVADILSDRAAAMDNKMHEALKKEEHPKVTFKVKDVNAAMGENQELKGKLNIAGVENDVSVPATITQKDGKLHITGERKIALKDYNIEPPTAMFGSIVVGDDVTVKFDLVFTKS
ncbi:YceI family protein [Pricia sp.]|uniref:YceI family protein n=1 Tax=Pricia sp. TaxID=2268138 RepID=UPI003592F271